MIIILCALANHVDLIKAHTQPGILHYLDIHIFISLWLSKSVHAHHTELSNQPENATPHPFFKHYRTSSRWHSSHMNKVEFMRHIYMSKHYTEMVFP